MTVRGFTLNDGGTGGSVGSISGTIPAAVVAGDVLVLFIVENVSTGQTFTPSGGGTVTWTSRHGPDTTASNTTTQVWTATAASDSASASVSVSTTNNGRFVGAGAGITGSTETGVVVDYTSQNTSTTSIPFPSDTVPDARGWEQLGLVGMRVATTTAATLTAPTGTTKQAEAKLAVATSPEYTATLISVDTAAGSGSHSPGTGTASAATSQANIYSLILAPSSSATGSITLGGSSTGVAQATSAGTVSLGGSSAVTSVSVVPNPGVVTLAGGTSTARGAATATGSVTLSGTVSSGAPAVFVDLYDFYLDAAGNLDRWMRGQITPPTQPTAPGVPTNVQASLSSGTATITWALPADGGSPLTAITVTREGGATHTLAPTATSDTFTSLGSGPYFFDISATNVVGTGPVAVAKTASSAFRFPGDPLPLLTGKIHWGGTENDNNGMVVDPTNEYCAPEADTGKKYSVIKIFYSGASVESCFTPSTGGIARDMKAHWSKGHIILANVAIQQSSSTHFSTWRKAGDTTDSVVHSTYFNFIQWCEEGADVPDCPIWLCMPHEAQQPSKVSLTTTSGMCPGDYGDLQRGFRKCMTDYAIAKVGGDGSAYKWKRLAFMGVHVGDAFTSTATDHDVDSFYTSFALGPGTAVGQAFAPKTVHDVIGGDPYQHPIQGETTPAFGRTGVPMWNNVAKAMVAWTKAKGVPTIFAEWGIRQHDGDAADQMQAFYDTITNGTNDVIAAVYWNSGSGGTIAAGNTHWLLTDHWDNDPAQPVNSLALRDSSGRLIGLKTCFENIMRDPLVVHFWDLGSPGIPGGYSKPPGV